MNFAELGVPSSLAHILEQQGITTPTPIQAATLPDSLAGRDVLGRGRTGSGKTYAFLLPLVARLDASKLPAMPRKPRALILAPTRELVGQIHAALAPLAKAAGLSSVVVYGGVGQNPQVTALKKGVDIVIACPGRLEDLMGQGYADLSAIEVTILDEADHMADLGFLPGVRRIMDKTPKRVSACCSRPRSTRRSTSWSSATSASPRPTRPTRRSRRSRRCTTTCCTSRVSSGCRSWWTSPAPPAARSSSPAPSTAPRRSPASSTRAACRPSTCTATCSQNARTRNMEAFHSGTATTLVATDIAARGIHVDDVALVIHADPPTEHKAYLHRSGRTARAGNEGTVITLMTDEQQRDVRDLTRLAGIKATTTKVNGPGHAMLEQLAPGVRSLPGGLVVEAPASTGGGGRSNGANAQRKRARSNGQTNGQSRRGNPTTYTSESGTSPSAGGGQRRRSGGGQGGQGGQGGGRARAVAATVAVAAVVAASPPAVDRRSRAQRVVVQPRPLIDLSYVRNPPVSRGFRTSSADATPDNLSDPRSAGDSWGAATPGTDQAPAPLGGGGGLRERCFDRSMRTMGVEEELLLVDGRTGEPRNIASEVIRAAGARDRDNPAPSDERGGSLGTSCTVAGGDRHAAGARPWPTSTRRCGPGASGSAPQPSRSGPGSSRPARRPWRVAPWSSGARGTTCWRSATD